MTSLEDCKTWVKEHRDICMFDDLATILHEFSKITVGNWADQGFRAEEEKQKAL